MMPTDVRIEADTSTKEAFMEAWERAGEPADSYHEFSRCHYPSFIDARELFLAAFKSRTAADEELERERGEQYLQGLRDGELSGRGEGEAAAVSRFLGELLRALPFEQAQLVGRAYGARWTAAVAKHNTRDGDGS